MVELGNRGDRESIPNASAMGKPKVDGVKSLKDLNLCACISLWQILCGFN